MHVQCRIPCLIGMFWRARLFGARKDKPINQCPFNVPQLERAKYRERSRSLSVLVSFVGFLPHVFCGYNQAHTAFVLQLHLTAICCEPLFEIFHGIFMRVSAFCFECHFPPFPKGKVQPKRISKQRCMAAESRAKPRSPFSIGNVRGALSHPRCASTKSENHELRVCVVCIAGHRLLSHLVMSG